MSYCMMPDIYYNDNYPRLYEKIENGRAVTISVNNEYGSIKSPVIMREIPINAPEKYFDLVTPYGYGGPIITSLLGDKQKLVDSFEEAMHQFVIENNIVSEFVRFHPVLGNALDFKSIYEIRFDRKTVGTNVKDYEIEDEFSKSARKYIKRAEKAGLTYEVILNPSEIKEFKEIYYSTMDRDKASDYYYFGDAYFENCLESLGEYVLYVKVIKEGKVIAAGFYFVCGDILECHLSGTLSEYLSLSPAYITKIATARWAKEHGIHFVHYGGGTTNDEDNKLYQFKKKFGNNTLFDFYIGRKVWNEKVYDDMCRMTGVDKNISYFPAYRSK